MVSLGVIKSYRLSCRYLSFPPLFASVLKETYLLQCPPFAASPKMRDILNDFSITARRFTIVGGGGQRAAALEPCTFQAHPLHLPFLCFRELRSYYDQTKVDHKKRTNLEVNIEFHLVLAPNVHGPTTMSRTK